MENEQADAGRDGRARLARSNSQARTQLTTSRIGNLTELTYTLLYVMTVHTYICTYNFCHNLVGSRALTPLPPLPVFVTTRPSRALFLLSAQNGHAGARSCDQSCWMSPSTGRDNLACRMTSACHKAKENRRWRRVVAVRSVKCRDSSEGCPTHARPHEGAGHQTGGAELGDTLP